MADPPTYRPYSPRIADMILADVDDFLDRNPRWGEIALMKAAGLDHRLLSRVRAGSAYRIDTVDRLPDAMNRAARGELNPDDFRNIPKRDADESDSEDSKESHARRQRRRPRAA
jgi:hypothetical protein